MAVIKGYPIETIQLFPGTVYYGVVSKSGRQTDIFSRPFVEGAVVSWDTRFNRYEVVFGTPGRALKWLKKRDGK